jgi:RHS repeat-associated protein
MEDGRAGNPNSWQREEHFNLDPMGNRRGWDYLATKGWQNFTRKDNGLNQYRMWSPYSIINYDDDIGNGWGSPGAANGVLMQDGWVTAGYNALNQPMHIWSGNVGWTYFGYDPLGRCVKRWADNGSVAYMYYDGWNLIQDGPQSSIADRVYVHGARTDEIVAQITPANNWIRYFHYDANGNCTLQTDGWGNLVEQYDYDAFGFPYFYDAWGNNIGYSPWGNRMLFTGREWLSDLKLYDYRARLYNPELGRFMQPDPKEFAAGDYNLYRYCHNDPVNHADPTGLSPTSEAIFTSAGEVIGFFLSLPVDAAEDVSTAGVGVLANPATTIGMTAAGGLAGRSLDHLINGNPSRNSVNQEGNSAPQAKATNPNSDISRAVSRFEKQKLGQQMKEYKNLEKTFKDHLEKYGQEAGATKGEVNRIERQLEQYRKILEDRGALPKTK